MKIINKLDDMTPNLYTEDYVNKLKEELNLTKENNLQLQQRIDKVKIEISALMSRYFYEEDFYIEDTDLDKLLQILDKGSDSNE